MGIFADGKTPGASHPPAWNTVHRLAKRGRPIKGRTHPPLPGSRNRQKDRPPRILDMSIQVYGCNHVAIEVGDVEKAVEFYQDVFGLEKLDEGEGDAFFKLGEHQFLAMFERKSLPPDTSNRHFGIMVRDEAQIGEVRAKLTGKYGIQLISGFRCDFRDPWGNRIQVVDLHDESLIWLLPYREVQKAGVKFQ